MHANATREELLARLNKYETMHDATLQELASTIAKMDKMAAEGKNKTVTYKQLIATKLMLTSFVNRFKLYDLEL